MQKSIQTEDYDPIKKEKNLELQRNIIAGHIIRKLHKQEGSYAYLIQLLDPYLDKKQRQLFGLPF